MSDNAADKIWAVRESVDNLEEAVEELKDRATTLVVKWGRQMCHIEQLTDEFARSRAEVFQLKKQLEEANKKTQQEGGKYVKGQSAQGQDGDNGIDPIAVFPEEVWRVIFGYLKEPQDLKSCCQTCTKFMWMLQDERKNFLFFDVLKVLQDHVEGFGPASPYYPHERSLSDLVKCRSVCYGWKQSVDKFFEQDCPIFPLNVPSYSDTDRPDASTALKFTPWENPWHEAALRELSPEINPMISHSLLIKETRRDRIPDHDVTEFLRRFGHHVWFLTVKLRNTFRDAPFSYWYQLLLAWLELTPNLKGLKLFRCGNTQPHDLIDLIWRRRFPNIPTMKVLTFMGCQDLILQAILTANPQIERLRIDRSDGYEWDLAIDVFRLKQLQELSYNLISCRELEGSNWNLQKLTLEYRDINWRKLFKSLEKKFASGTLVELNLSLWGPNPDPTPRLSLPNLRILSLEIMECFNSIDFILPCPSKIWNASR